ncbi:hypothetical protein NP233_g8687 [Leucocoprinus birnbaumii]|uniref:Uncharacterized protein n=1 Tax=Leucocoprinus birnbaumii TaxID=56174 RepID=A0AAD5VNJ9_9AGAR|nr:hypothetical protein NP233_g8687 [Leucocoprinus birnbaumii]
METRSLGKQAIDDDLGQVYMTHYIIADQCMKGLSKRDRLASFGTRFIEARCFHREDQNSQTIEDGVRQGIRSESYIYQRGSFTASGKAKEGKEAGAVELEKQENATSGG